MFNPIYLGCKLMPSRAVLVELLNEGKTLEDVLEVLEYGYDAPRKRAPGVIERWLDRGSKTANVVVALDYNETLREEVWVIVHLGSHTTKRSGVNP